MNRLRSPEDLRSTAAIQDRRSTGGITRIHDPATDTWTATRNIGENPPAGPLTPLLSGEILLPAGESSHGTDAICSLHDFSTNAWLRTGTLHQARTGHTATRLQNGQVLAAGGEARTSIGVFSISGSAELHTP